MPKSVVWVLFDSKCAREREKEIENRWGGQKESDRDRIKKISPSVDPSDAPLIPSPADVLGSESPPGEHRI